MVHAHVQVRSFKWGYGLGGTVILAGQSCQTGTERLTWEHSLLFDRNRTRQIPIHSATKTI